MLHPLIKVEPYWNVNQYGQASSTINYFIKVEPYWNVNSDFTLASTISALH